MSNSAQTTVCVTGAGGYIGSHVTRELLERGKSLWMKQMADIVSPAYPELKVPTRRIPGFAVYAAALFDKRISFGFAHRMVGRMDAISNEKATRELGVQFRPVEQSILDTCESFFEGGYLSRPEKTSS